MLLSCFLVAKMVECHSTVIRLVFEFQKQSCGKTIPRTEICRMQNKYHSVHASVTTTLPLRIRTGKYILGLKRATKSVISKQAKCLIVSSNFPSNSRKLLEYDNV